jgi:molecular chaperone GrpE
MSRQDSNQNDNQQDDNLDQQYAVEAEDQVLENEQSEVRDERDQLMQDLQRVQADFVNFKRGVDTQLATAEQRGKMQATLKFLDIVDDIERALNHVPEELEDNQWVQGLEKVYANLQKKMAELKLSKIEALGQPFDPSLHEAVMRGDDEDSQDVVTDVLKNGYTYEGVVVRHAMVKVG